MPLLFCCARNVTAKREEFNCDQSSPFCHILAPPHPLNKVFGFYEELLSARFPHSSYKLVFVHNAYQEAASYSTLGIFR